MSTDTQPTTTIPTVSLLQTTTKQRPCWPVPVSIYPSVLRTHATNCMPGLAFHRSRPAMHARALPGTAQQQPSCHSRGSASAQGPPAVQRGLRVRPYLRALRKPGRAHLPLPLRCRVLMPTFFLSLHYSPCCCLAARHVLCVSVLRFLTLLRPTCSASAQVPATAGETSTADSATCWRATCSSRALHAQLSPQSGKFACL